MIFDKIPIFDRNSIFLTKTWIFDKILIFDKNLIFLMKTLIFDKILIFDKNFEDEVRHTIRKKQSDDQAFYLFIFQFNSFPIHLLFGFAGDINISVRIMLLQ